MEPGTLAKVLHDFFTVVEGELSLSKGNYFLIHKVIDKHWCYGESNNMKGNFPLRHLHKVELPLIHDNEVIFIAIASYQSQHSGDLTFYQGELIIGNNQDLSEWLCGHIGSRNGIFPASFVWKPDPTIMKRQLQKKITKRKAKVKTTLKAQLDEELDLIKDEIVTVTEVLDDGWCRGIANDGKEGIFPEAFITYLEYEDELEIPENNIPELNNLYPAIGKDFEENYSIPNSISSYQEAAPRYEDLFPNKPASSFIETTEIPDSNPNPLGLKPYAISIYPFNAQFPNELSFEAGQVVELIKYIDKEWLEGIIDDKKGIFPMSYVKVIVDVDCNDPENDAVFDNGSEAQTSLKPGTKVKVEFTFVAQMNGDLSVNEGDIVTVIEMSNNDWVTIENRTGEVGLCPRSYLSSDYDPNEPEVLRDTVDDFVVLRHDHKNIFEKSDIKVKRLSEPHRPAPPVPTPGRVPLQKQTNSTMSVESDVDISVKTKQKKADQRQNIISELYYTEKDFVRDLKLTYETFNLHNPSFLESKGIDVTALFGNLEEVTKVAEELLELIQRAMKGCDEDYQTVGPCFLKMADKMKNAYGKYCSNHELSLSLLQKYEDNKEIMKIFAKGVETLKMQVTCFDMNSVLIKPVQRILKYPLMLNELLKCTEDDHPDKPKILEAANVMADVASYINEYKRKKELASKYLYSDNTLLGKMANVSMHSAAKKASRFSAKISASLGLTNLPYDPKFEELEKDFQYLEKTSRQLLTDVRESVTLIDQETLCGDVLVELLNQYFQGMPNNEILRLRKVRSAARLKYLAELRQTIEVRIIAPLNSLLTLLSGPAYLIEKRNNKKFDFDSALSTNEKGKMSEELSLKRSTFETLNQQLLEELPILLESAIDILHTCVKAFTNARKLFNGKIMKQYIVISEHILRDSSIPDFSLETFLVQHNLLFNQISRFSGNASDSPNMEQLGDYSPQSHDQKITLRSKYPPNKLFVASRSVSSSNQYDLSVMKGTLVGVIKTQDPMGDPSRWYVDNGSVQGFLESHLLKLSEEEVIRTPESIYSNVPQTGNNFNEYSNNLISLDSPAKEVQKKLIEDECLYSNIYEEPSDPPPLYEDIYELKEKNNQMAQFITALYDFDGSKFPGTLSIRAGQTLKILRKHDERNNPQWWLVECREGGKGYVPYNYLGPSKQRLSKKS